MEPSNEHIARQEAHIIDLARIVGAAQGEPKPDAVPVRIYGNQVKDGSVACCDTHGGFPYGEAQWHAADLFDAKAAVFCPYCLPGEIEAGEVILDRRSAHATLAEMLGGWAGREGYLAYFDYAEAAEERGELSPTAERA